MQAILREGFWIIEFIGQSFWHILPYLALSIPLAVYLRRSGLSKKIEVALRGRAVLAVIIATFIGAVSPFCSCGVVPVIAALLTGGVPLAPVMSFWIASPSMDPEIFFLSVGTLGWELALWRLSSTFVISLASGLVTLWLEHKGLIGANILRGKLKSGLHPSAAPSVAVTAPALAVADASAALVALPVVSPSCCSESRSFEVSSHTAPTPCEQVEVAPGGATTTRGAGSCGCSGASPTRVDLSGIARDTWREILRLVFYMGVAFLLEAVIERYVPQHLIAGLLGKESALAVPFATLIGIPFYTTELSALGIVSGLMTQGMTAAAALAFLVGGGVTTLPAMAAVWGIVRPRIFALYLGFCVAGSLLAGFSLQLVHALLS